MSNRMIRKIGNMTCQLDGNPDGTMCIAIYDDKDYGDSWLYFSQAVAFQKFHNWNGSKQP